MTEVERVAGDFVVDAALLADAFGLTEEQVTTRMRDGTITSRCEAGVEEDAGRWRLTFHHEDRACRLIVDASGAVLRKATFPIRSRAQSVAGRKADGGASLAGEDGVG